MRYALACPNPPDEAETRVREFDSQSSIPVSAIPAAADMLPFSAPDEVLKARIPQFRETTYWLNEDVIAEFEGGPDKDVPG